MLNCILLFTDLQDVTDTEYFSILAGSVPCKDCSVQSVCKRKLLLAWTKYYQS